MSQTSKRLLSIGIAFVFVVAAIIVLLNIVQPEYTAMETIKGQVIGEKNLLADEQRAIAQVQQSVSNFKNQNDVKVALAVPIGQDLAGALAQIYGLAQNAGITIQAVSVGTPTLQSAQAGSGNNPRTTAQLVKPLGSITFQVSAVGSYENLKNFLSGIETNVRIFDLSNLTLTPGSVSSGGAGSGAQNLFTYGMTFSTYYQPPQ